MREPPPDQPHGAAFLASSRACRARMSAPTIWPPQMTCRFLVLMAGDDSAVTPNSQSTRAREVITRDRFFLVKPAPGYREKIAIAWNRGARRGVESTLPADAPKAPGR